MIKKLLIFIFVGFSSWAYSQEIKISKPPIDSTCFTWGHENYKVSPVINNDGRYIYYITSNSILVVQSTDGKKQEKYSNAYSPCFSQDSKRILFQRNDSIFFVNLENGRTSNIAGVAGKYETLSYNRSDNLILYKLQKDSNQLHIVQLSTSDQMQISFSVRYWYSEYSKAFVFLIKDTNKEISDYSLQYGKFMNGAPTEFWKGGKISNLLFSNDGNEVAFLCTNRSRQKEIWYCKMQNLNSIKLLVGSSPEVEATLEIDNILGFSTSKNKLWFELRTKTSSKFPPNSVDVYNYKDAKLQSEQLYGLQHNQNQRNYKAFIDIDKRKMKRVEGDNEFVFFPRGNNRLYDDYALLFSAGKGSRYESNWNPDAEESSYILSLNNGSKKLIYDKIIGGLLFELTPDERYVVYYDPGKQVYCSFEAATGIVRDITAGLRTNWIQANNTADWADWYTRHYPIAGFTQDSRYVLLYDQNDIYLADLTGETGPLNITGGYGKKHGLQFRVSMNSEDISKQAKYILQPHEKILLTVFDLFKKDIGFCRLSLDSSRKFEHLILHPYNLHLLTKARDANVYLLFQQDACSFTNTVISSDLTNFQAITNYHPEINYNWLSSELITWKIPDGRNCQGILYKPENFDSAKKYPLIVTYYERQSDDLHRFLIPNYSSATIDIPYYVSNGYLVFMPDIYYKLGDPGKSVLSCVVSGVKYLLNRAYIDSKHLGLNGHSWGGFETNYIITHSNMFEAAVSGAGMTDFVSIYGSIIGDGSSRQRAYEIYRDRMGATLWQIPEKYIENSAVLSIDKITTPVLIMANKEDEDVPYQQGVELFTGLRRLGKPSWMLQYDGQGHGLSDLESQKDFTLRMFQFFNYYLKGMPAPKWMAEGVPAEKKAFFSGTEPDKGDKKL